MYKKSLKSAGHVNLLFYFHNLVTAIFMDSTLKLTGQGR